MRIHFKIQNFQLYQIEKTTYMNNATYQMNILYKMI